MIVPGELLNRAKHEYVEMPGLALTVSQASRLWNLDVAMCEALLSSLEREHFLSRTRRAAYVRRDTGSPRLRVNEAEKPLPGPDHDEAERVDDRAPIAESPSRVPPDEGADEDHHWIVDLDGQSIRAAGRAWEVRSCGQRVDDHRWLPVALVGRPYYTAFLKMAPTAQLQDAIHALEWWLANPGRESGDVIEVE